MARVHVHGLDGKAVHATGAYACSDIVRHNHSVFNQVDGAEGTGHELSHDGGAWTIALTEDKRKCWAFAESDDQQPSRIAREEWQVYNGVDWVPAPQAFVVSNAPAAAAAADASPSPGARSLPPGWESSLSRTNGQTYYLNTATGVSQWDFPEPEPEPEPSASSRLEPEPEPEGGGGRAPLVQYSGGVVEDAMSKVRAQLQAERWRREKAEAALERELATQADMEQEIVQLQKGKALLRSDE